MRDEPDLGLAGLSIWVLGRQFPDQTDYWDGNWLNVTAHCGVTSASVWASGAILTVSDIALWASQCVALYESGQGQAALQPCEPNLLVILRSFDRLASISTEAVPRLDQVTGPLKHWHLRLSC